MAKVVITKPKKEPLTKPQKTRIMIQTLKEREAKAGTKPEAEFRNGHPTRTPSTRPKTENNK